MGDEPWHLDLLTPEDHADAYVWAAVALAHVALGLALVAVAAAAGLRGGAGLAIVVTAYLLVWEIALQRLGAGLGDAILDAAMVAAGGALGLLAWRRDGPRLAIVLAGVAAALWHGIRGRG